MSHPAERRLLGDFWRYTACGTAATLADYVLWWLLTTQAGWWTIGAQAFSRPAGGLVGFVGNRLWTWRRRRDFALRRQFIRFWIIWAILYPLAAVALWALTTAMPDDPRGRFAAKLIADLSVTLLGFALQRAVTFR